MKGHRMSAAPIARYCAKGPIVSGPYAVRAATQSTCFHALCSDPDSPNTKRLFDLLDPAERADLAEWHRPPDVKVGDVLLRYSEAEKELEVAISTDGYPCRPDDPDCLSVGHLDIAWVVEIDGIRIAYVPDIKRSEWTTPDGPESLQIHAYGLTFAMSRKCDYYCPGIWAAKEGVWQWGALVEIGSPRSIELLDNVLAALSNLPDANHQYTVGAHCMRCWGREYCPAWLIPPEHATTELQPFTEPGMALTPESGLRLLLLAERAEDTAAKVKKNIQAAVAKGLRITDGQRVYRPVQMPGRKSLDKAAMEAAGINTKDYTKEGSPYARWDWGKA